MSGILTRVKPTETSIETLELAATDLRIGASFVEPDGLIVHPSTWSLLRRTKDSTVHYIVGDPTGGETMRLWNIPVTETTAIAAGTALLANFAQSTMAYVREGIRVETSKWGTTPVHHQHDSVPWRGASPEWRSPVRPV